MWMTLVAVLALLSVMLPSTTCQEVLATEETVAAVDGGDVDLNDLPHKLRDDSEKRVWGASSSLSPPPSSSSASTSASLSEEDAAGANSSTGRPVSTIPFVMAKSTSKEFHDPFAKGFQISARVYTDPHDKLAHFDIYDVTSNGGNNRDNADDVSDSTTPIVFPYWECGLAGSTTVPVPLQHVTVRHLLGGSKPSSFASEGDFGPHPQLVIPLTAVQVVLNSGEVRTFSPGHVILLENVITGGHKLQGHEQHDMTVLLLTFPHAYHQVGKEHNALQSIFEKSFWKQNPCKTGAATKTTTSSDGEDHTSHCSEFDSFSRRPSSDVSAHSFRSGALAKWVGPPRNVRRVGLGIIGLGLTLAVADFLGKCAPLILAVAFGGGAIVVGGTYGLVKLGEYGLDELDIWHEKRLLRLSSSSSSSSTPSSSSASEPDGGGGPTSAGSTAKEASSSRDDKAKRRIPESGGTETATPPLRAFSSAQDYIQQAQPRGAAAAAQ